jgi:hypothetical protein
MENEPKTNGKRNRTAGLNWERLLAKTLRELGYKHIVTTRSESRTRDAQKIDLINKNERENGRFPLNIQAKTTNTHLPYAKLLAEMPVGPEYNVIFHKMTKKTEVNFITTGTYAILQLDDFLYMFNYIYKYETSNN